MKDEDISDRKGSVFRSFILLLGKYRAEYVMVVAISSFLYGMEGILHPLLMKAIFDEAASRGSFNHFVGLILGYLVFGLTLNLAGYGISLWQMKVDNKIVHRVSGDLLKSYYRKDYRDVLHHGDGYYMARIRSDVKDGVVPMIATVRTIVMKFSSLIALVFVLIFISWKAFLILLVIIPISTIVSVVVGKKIRELTSLERDQEAGVLASLTKSISAFKMVRNFDLLSKTLGAYENSMASVLASTYKKYRVIRMLQGTNDITMVVSDFCSMFIGAVFVFRQQMTFGSYLAFMNSFWRSTTTLMEIFRQWGDLHSHGTTIKRVTDFIAEDVLLPYYLPGPSVSAINISYTYGAADVFSQFSVELTDAERVLIVGRNGSGKTTLANILSGYLPPSTGGVSLPVRISSITLPLFFPPLRTSELGVDPIFLDMFHLSSKEIMDSYPDQLSAGQQQKLALALALSQEADLYILDEPLANLDVESKVIAMRAIFDRTKQTALIVIMHGAEEYFADFDRIVQLGGQIYESPHSLIKHF